MSDKKERILDISLSLFLEKGFDDTSISDILRELDIARGTLYYHFESKEAIMDAVIDRIGEKTIQRVEEIVKNKDLTVYEKLYKFFSSMSIQEISEKNQIVDYLHSPQNALFHEKTEKMILNKVSPLLTEVLYEGINKKIFDNKYPKETARLILVAVNGFLDDEILFLSKEDFSIRLESLIYNIEKILSAKEGSLSYLKTLFN